MIVELPDVSGLHRSAIEHTNGQLYLERFDVFVSKGCTVRLHHWHASDDDRAPHDHPWPSTTTVLRGELREFTPEGVAELSPGTVVTRSAAQPHRIELVSADAWTLFVVGAPCRRWGFHTEGGWVHWRDWPHAGRVIDELTGREW